MSELTFGVRITYEGRDANAGLEQTRAGVEKVGAAASELASQYSGLNQTIKEHSTAVTETSGSAKKLMDRYDPLGAKLRQLQADFKALDRAAAGGKIADSDAVRMDKVYANLQREMAAASSGMEEVGAKTVNLGLNSQYARRELMQLGKEALSGDFSRMPGTFGALVTHSNLLAAAMSPVGLAVAGVGVALGAGVAAWHHWGAAAEEAAKKAAAGLEDVHKKADAVQRPSKQQQLRQLTYQIQSAELDAQFQAGVAANTQKSNEIRSIAAKTAGEYRRLAEGLRQQKAALEKQIAEDNKPKDSKSPRTQSDSNAAYLAALQRESDILEMTAGQIKIYDAAKRGIVGAEMQQVMALATEADARDAAAKSAKDHARAVAEANRILAEIDPVAKASQEWERLSVLMAAGALTAEQAGAAYAKAMGDVDKKTQDGADKMSATWANFRDNTQRVLGDQLFDGIMGKFNSLEDAFKQMLARMVANAAAQNITAALFGTNGGGGSAGNGLIKAAMRAFGFANGGAFGTAHAFAAGGTFTNGLYTSPTPFKFAAGGGFNLGVMGEAGPEAVMPLARDSSGKLGVRARGGGGSIVINDHTTINVDSRTDRAQVIADTSRLIEQRQAQLVERLRRERAIG